MSLDTGIWVMRNNSNIVTNVIGAKNCYIDIQYIYAGGWCSGFESRSEQASSKGPHA